MVDKFTKSIDERAGIAFNKVKRDIIYLKERLKQYYSIKLKRIEKNQILIQEDIETKYNFLLKKIEKLEKENKELKKRNQTKSDLTKIEGIGPIIQDLLRSNNINSFEDLSKTKVSTLKKILDENKLNYHDPTTWPKQSKLAHSGKWEKLLEWQDILIGGKEIK